MFSLRVLLYKGKADRLQEFLQCGVDSNCGDATEQDNTMLHWAAGLGQVML
jgi:hypothetical protein